MSLDQNENQDLVKLKMGDEAAYNRLFRRYYKDVFYKAYRVLGNQYEAEEVAQILFADLWLKRKNTEVKNHLKSYLLKATVFKTYDYIKSKKRKTTEHIDEHIYLADNNENAQQDLENQDLENQIRNTIEKLPDRCRLIFKLSRFEQMSYNEIATQLSISKKTVENQMTKALKLLREAVFV